MKIPLQSISLKKSQLSENQSISYAQPYNTTVLYTSEETAKQKEQLQMSYCIALANDRYIVLAADSRSIIPTEDGIGQIDDAFRKILYLPQVDTTIITAGTNRIQKEENMPFIPITDFLSSIENELAEHSTTAHEIIEYLVVSLQELIDNADAINLLLIKNGEGYYADVKARDYQINKMETIWRAGSCIGTVDRMYSDPTGLTISVPDFSLQDMIRFAKHAIASQIEYLYFTRQPSAIGGPIQICVIDKIRKTPPDFSFSELRI